MVARLAALVLERALISYYMTVRNGLPFIEGSIKSVLGQEGVDFELIVVDDGSVDGTASFLENFPRCGNMVVIISPATGRARALNLAVSKAKYDFVCNIDADDVLHPKHGVSCASKLMIGDCDVACSRPYVFSDVAPAWNSVKELLSFDNVNRELMRRNPVCHSGAIIRKESFCNVGGYDESRSSQFDYDLWFRIAAAGGVIERTDERLVGKRIHRGQSYENKRRIRYVRNSLSVQRRVIRHFGGGYFDYAVLLARGAYSFVPQQLRAWLRREDH